MPSRTRMQLQHNFTRFRVASKSKRISAKTIILSAGGGKGGERDGGGGGESRYYDWLLPEMDTVRARHLRPTCLSVRSDNGSVPENSTRVQDYVVVVFVVF